MKKQNKTGKKKGIMKWVLVPLFTLCVAAGIVAIYGYVEENRYQELVDGVMYERFEEELQKRYFNYDVTEESYIPGYTWQDLLDMGLVARDNDKEADSDLDGLSDYDELVVYHTNPAAFSTAGDMYSDKYKVENGLDTEVYLEGFVTPNVEEGLKVELEPVDGLNTQVYMSSYVWDNDEEQNGFVASITIGPYEGNIKYDLSEYGEGMTAALVRYDGEFIKLKKYIDDDILYFQYIGDTPATLLIYKKKNESKVKKAVKNNQMLMPEAEEYTYFVSPQMWNEKMGTSEENSILEVYFEKGTHVEGMKTEVIYEIYDMTPDKYKQIFRDNGIAYDVGSINYCDEKQKELLDKYAVSPVGTASEELFTEKTNAWAKMRGEEEMYLHKILGFTDEAAFYDWVMGYGYKAGDIRGEVQCVDSDVSFELKKDTFVFPNFQSYIGTDGNCMGLARVMAALYNGENLYPYERSYSGDMDCEYDLYSSVHETLFDRYLDDYLNKKYFKKLGKKMLDSSKLTTEENNFVNFIGMYWMEGNDLFYAKRQFEIVREGQNPDADALVALSEYLAEGKMAVVCLLGEGGGHVINAYEIESCTYDPNKFFIHCYDTNYVGETTTIEVYVNEKTDTFSYVYEPSESIRFSSETYSTTILKSGEKCNIIAFCDENMNVLK